MKNETLKLASPLLVDALEDAIRQLDATAYRLASDVSPAHPDYITKARAAQVCERIRDDCRAALAAAKGVQP